MNGIQLIVMGGSWGGIQASLAILKNLPEDYPIPILLILHRLKDSDSDLEKLLGTKIQLKVKEVVDKEFILHGNVYLAPPNYHVLVEKEKYFSLDISEPVNFSRPSIDITFKSAAQTYGPSVMGILLTGANKDGSEGLKSIIEHGGKVIVQNPDEAEKATMPLSALNEIPECDSLHSNCKILSLQLISEFLLKE